MAIVSAVYLLLFAFIPLVCGHGVTDYDKSFNEDVFDVSLKDLNDFVQSKSIDGDVLLLIGHNEVRDNQEWSALAFAASQHISVVRIRVKENHDNDDEEGYHDPYGPSSHDHYHDFEEDNEPGDAEEDNENRNPEEIQEERERRDKRRRMLEERKQRHKQQEEQQQDGNETGKEEVNGSLLSLIKKEFPTFLDSLNNGPRFVYIQKPKEGENFSKPVLIPEQDSRSDAKIAEWIRVSINAAGNVEIPRDNSLDELAKKFYNARKSMDFMGLASNMQDLFKTCQGDEDESSPCFKKIRGYATVMKQLTSFELEDVDEFLQNQFKMLSRLVKPDVQISLSRKEQFRERLHALHGFATMKTN